MRRPALYPGSWLFGAAVCGFFAGLLVTGGLDIFPARAAAPADVPVDVSTLNSQPPTPEVEVLPSLKETPPAVAPPPPTVRPTDVAPVISIDSVEDLRRRHLTLPVEGLHREDLRDTFHEMRGGGTRPHEALDVLVARNTPVLAVEDGSIAKLFLSDAGGITIYQFDPSERYVYYYAHLERYAAGLKVGDQVKRGQEIGYVGTTGNAPKDTPHLHFQVMLYRGRGQYWGGDPINPHPYLTRKGPRD